MITTDPDAENPTELSETEKLWLEEIIRETEHYYQGEIQQDQRASWLLATAGLLIATVVTLELAAMDKGYKIAQLPLAVGLIAFSVSGALSILTLLPLRGTKLWTDIFGGTHRRYAELGIDQLIEKQFRLDEGKAVDSYKKRIKYHFRSHYLRSNRKAYGIIWSSVFLLIGLVALAAVIPSMLG